MQNDETAVLPASPETHYAVLLTIEGRVQGVGFRFWAKTLAQNLALTGWVRNKDDGDVEAWAEGTRQAIEQFIDHCHLGPATARVTRVVPDWQQELQNLPTFVIKQ